MATKKSSTKKVNSDKPAATKAKQGKKNKKVSAKQTKVIDDLAIKTVDAIAVKGVDDLAVKGVDDLAVKTVDDLAIKSVDAVAVKSVDAVALKTVDAVAVKGVNDLVAKDIETIVEANATSAQETIATIISENASPTIETETKFPKQNPSKTPAHTEINPYLPHIATVIEVIKETHNIVTLRVVIDDKTSMENFSYQAGQVGQLSIFGVGEATFVINSPPFFKDYLQFSVMKTGEVTSAIHKLSAGDKIGVRGPLGNSFPWESWKGKDIFFVGGGVGMAPIRTIMLQVLEHGNDFGKISLLYGARSPLDMAFSYELDKWMTDDKLDCTLTIDAPADNWQHKVGLIPNILLELAPDPTKTIAVLCGPPIMIKFTVQALEKMNFAGDSIFTTLEKRMKCGIGLCGRCNIGGKYVCIDGPVFSWTELKDLPPEL